MLLTFKEAGLKVSASSHGLKNNMIGDFSTFLARNTSDENATSNSTASEQCMTDLSEIQDREYKEKALIISKSIER